MIEGEELELFERSLRQATSSRHGDDLDAALAELGWVDALEFDPATAIPVLFRLQGEFNTTSSSLDRVLRAAVGVDSAVVMPQLGSWQPPGSFADGRLSLHGVGGPALAGAQKAIVVATAEGNTSPVAVTVEVGALSVRTVSGIDPAFGLVEVSASGLPARDGVPVGWEDAAVRAQLALGHELAGAARRMLGLAREHAMERIQFGQPIARFQAVRHRLAETLVAVEAAEAVLGSAWPSPPPALAAMGKALAGRGARSAARHCQQVLAGIGFTAEHPFHLYLRRVMLLDQLFGTARGLTDEFGRELVRTRSLPDLLPL